MPIHLIRTRSRALFLGSMLVLLGIVLMPGTWGVAYGQTAGEGGGGGGGFVIGGGVTTTTTTVTTTAGGVTTTTPAIAAVIPATTQTTIVSPAAPNSTPLTLFVPQGVIGQDVTITVGAPNLAPTPETLTSLGFTGPTDASTLVAVFDLTAVTSNGTPIGVNGTSNFSADLTITIAITPAMQAIAAAGGTITLQFLNEAANPPVWTTEELTLNADGTASATINHFSRWALIAQKVTLTGRIPAAGGYGLIVYGGGTLDALVTATGCPRASMALWMTTRTGTFVPYVPGTLVAVVNAEFLAAFGGGANIPPNTAFIGKCR